MEFGTALWQEEGPEGGTTKPLGNMAEKALESQLFALLFFSTAFLIFIIFSASIRFVAGATAASEDDARKRMVMMRRRKERGSGGQKRLEAMNGDAFALSRGGGG